MAINTGFFSETNTHGMQERGRSFETEVTCSAENTSAELSLCQLIETSSFDKPAVTRPVAKQVELESWFFFVRRIQKQNGKETSKS